mgnify:CR=1 FL=1
MNLEHRLRTPSVSWSFSEGKYWDLWMIVHFCSGVVKAYIMPFIDAPRNLLIGIAFFGMVTWEAIEYFFDIHEVIENRILDIIFGLTGLLLVSNHVVPYLAEKAPMTWALAGALVVLIILLLLGWKAYEKRSQTKKENK